MKQFSIAQLLIYDPTRKSPKRKPIEIDIQEAKLIAYVPSEVPLEQKCNTVGMAEGVYNFCHSLLIGKEEESEKTFGWQTIFMDTCTIILSEVQQNIWIFVKLEHANERRYLRMGETELSYQEESFTESTCKLFMEQLYLNFKLFYGNIRSWVFKQKFDELQQIVSSFLLKFQDIYKVEGKLDILPFAFKQLRMIPLDINSTLKFTYFKNVLQSYNQNIAHLLIYAYGVLAFSSMDKDETNLLTNYLFSTGEPYFFSDQLKTRMNILPEMPKSSITERFGVIYNSKILGFEENNEVLRYSAPKAQGTDLLGLTSEANKFQLFDIFFQEELPLKINFYSQSNMFFVTLYKNTPNLSELIFQNRFYHDNADKFISKISQTIPGLLKPSDPYRFLFHNCATYTGKSTIREWKNTGFYVRQTFLMLINNDQGIVTTSTHHGYWLYGMHRFSRILILLVPTDVSLGKIEEYASKMTKEYFTRAYL